MEAVKFLVLIAITTVAASRTGLSRDCHLNQVAPNPKNPHTFYWCLSNGPVLMRCMEQLIFEPALRKCISTKEQASRRRGISRRDISRQPSKNEKNKFLADLPLKKFEKSVPKLEKNTQKLKRTVPKVEKPIPYVDQSAPKVSQRPLEADATQRTNDYALCSESYRNGFEAPTIYAQNMFNCSQFYSCSNGRAILLECPHGLYFNPVSTVNACDYPRNVPSCKMGTGLATPPRLSSTSPEEDETPRVEPSPLDILQSLS